MENSNTKRALFDASEDLTHSAILAQHGISLTQSDPREKDACRDAADNILDKMDRQLNDVGPASFSNTDVNDDPGTDLDTVRTLRNRIMSDLNSDYEHGYNDTQHSSKFDFYNHNRTMETHASMPRKNSSKPVIDQRRSKSQNSHRDVNNNGRETETHGKHKRHIGFEMSIVHNQNDIEILERYLSSREQKQSRSGYRGPGSVRSISTVRTEDYEDSFRQMMVRQVAGVPVTSFDSVTIASDLDSVATEAVREQFIDGIRRNKASAGIAKSFDSSSNSSTKAQNVSHLREYFQKLNGYNEKNENKVSISSKDGLLPSRHTSLYKSSPTVERKSDNLYIGNRSLRYSDTVPLNDAPLPGSLHKRSRSQSLEVLNKCDKVSTSTEPYLRNRNASMSDLSKSTSRYETRSEQRLSQASIDNMQELNQQREEIKTKKKELKQMQSSIERYQINLLKLEEKLRDSQAKSDDARAELMVLEFKREQCRKELEKETERLEKIREKENETDALGMSTDEIIAVIEERDELKSRFRRGEASITTIVERQELERALHSAKDDLFKERKLARAKVEELEEKLEEAQHNLDVVMNQKNDKQTMLDSRLQEVADKSIDEGNNDVPDQYASKTESKPLLQQVEQLGNQLKQKDNEIVSLATETNRIREENRQLNWKITELEDKISQKNKLRDKFVAETEQKMCVLKDEKEQAVAASKLGNEREMKKLLENVEKQIQDAVNEYKKEQQEEIKKCKSQIENKKMELEQTQEQLRQQQTATRALGERLRLEAKEQVRSSLAKERLAWEQEKLMTSQLEDEVRRETFEKEKKELRNEIEEAKNKCKKAANEIAKMRNEIEDLQKENFKLHQEKLDEATKYREQERKDSIQKIERIRTEIEEKKQQEVSKYRKRCSLLEEELRNLKNDMTESKQKCKQANVNAERAERCFATEVGEECRKLADLVLGIRTPSQSLNRAKGVSSRSFSNLQRSSQFTNAEGVLTQLRAISDDVRATLRDLVTEVETHRRAAQIMQDKSRPMVGNTVEYVKHGRKMQTTHNGDTNGYNLSKEIQLKRQLVEKDNELREIQHNMSMWKDTTAQKLSLKFEEEFKNQLERKLSHHTLDHHKQRKFNGFEADHSPFNCNGASNHILHEFDSTLQTPPVKSSTPNPAGIPGNEKNDKGTVKLLRHLQGRVKQLRAENDLLRSSSEVSELDKYRKSR